MSLEQYPKGSLPSREEVEKAKKRLTETGINTEEFVDDPAQARLMADAGDFFRHAATTVGRNLETKKVFNDMAEEEENKVADNYENQKIDLETKIQQLNNLIGDLIDRCTEIEGKHKEIKIATSSPAFFSYDKRVADEWLERDQANRFILERYKMWQEDITAKEKLLSKVKETYKNLTGRDYVFDS